MTEMKRTPIAGSDSEEGSLVEKGNGINAVRRSVIVGALAAVALGVGTALLFGHVIKENKFRAQVLARPAKPVSKGAAEATSLVVDTGVLKNVGNSAGVIEVDRHVRNLHSGWKASPDAIARANALGIELGANQTFVRDYSRIAA